MDEIKLGDKVRCKHTGFVGIAVAKSEFINGCIQYMVAPKVGKDNKILEDIGIDSQSLELVKPKKKPKKKKERRGGPTTKGLKMKGY